MRRWLVVVLGIGLMGTAGCAITLAKRSPWDIQQLAALSDQLEQFKTLAQLKAEEAEDLRRAKGLLDGELSASEAAVGYDERGLVTRMLDRVLFDSGKAKLRRSALPVLDKVAEALNAASGQPIGVEGHTDNLPIRYSGWASNKALAVARAQAVVEYLTTTHGLDSSRFIPVGVGEEQPIASNDTAAGRQLNRRVEVIILPQSSGSSYRTKASQAGQAGTVYAK